MGGPRQAVISGLDVTDTRLSSVSSYSVRELSHRALISALVSMSFPVSPYIVAALLQTLLSLSKLHSNYFRLVSWPTIAHDLQDGHASSR